MSKLQEIKDDVSLAKSESRYTINSVSARNKIVFEHADWLISQLEQAQEANKCQDCGGSGTVELCHDPLYTERCICTYDPAKLVIEIGELRKQLEQAQEREYELSSKLSLEEEKHDATTELLEEIQEQLKYTKEYCYTVKAENEQLEKEVKRYKEIINDQEVYICKLGCDIGDLKTENEQLKADKQKLIEVAEWYGNKNLYFRTEHNMASIDFDEGQRARQALSEVKGNGSTE